MIRVGLGIRRGTGSVTVWRELRRIDEPLAGDVIEACRSAANDGDGFAVERANKVAMLRPPFEVHPLRSQLDDSKERLIGVGNESGAFAVTRDTRWEIRRNGDSPRSLDSWQ